MALLRRMIGYGLKFHVSILAGAIIIRADLLVVNYFRGAAEAGVYSVASQFALLLMLLPGRDCDTAFSARYRRTGCARRDHLPGHALHDIHHVSLLSGGGSV